MAILTTEEIIEATGGKLLSGNSSSFVGVSIDSRTVSKGEMFFALKGPRFDGHDFLAEAISKGAGGFVVEREIQFPVPSSQFPVIIVQDTLKALQDLAHFLRAKKKIPVVAVTGSNGKTTTKEMIYTILSQKLKVLKNEGNLNNHIGLPLSLTRLEPYHEAVVLELGMNASGEIRRLCEIAVPTHGVITNIGTAHVGKLGDLTSIRNAKLELLEGLEVAVLNADDSFLMEGINPVRKGVSNGESPRKNIVSNGVKGFNGEIITFSINPVRKPMQGFLSNGVKAENVSVTDRGSSFTLRLKNDKSATITLNIHGLFNIYNALAASAVCERLGMDIKQIKTAIEAYKAFPMRFEVIKGHGVTLINDSYNANPSSMGEALKEMVRMGGMNRTVAVLGDMFELGDFSEEAHRAIGRAVTDMGIDIFVAVGEMMEIAAQESQRDVAKNGSRPETYTFKNADEVSQSINKIIKEGDIVLLKGSRAMSMEKILERIKDVDISNVLKE